MIYLVYCLQNVSLFDIPLSYYYINLQSSIICCLFFGDIYLSFGIPVSHSFFIFSISLFSFLLHTFVCSFVYYFAFLFFSFFHSFRFLPFFLLFFSQFFICLCLCLSECILCLYLFDLFWNLSDGFFFSGTWCMIAFESLCPALLNT